MQFSKTILLIASVASTGATAALVNEPRFVEAIVHEITTLQIKPREAAAEQDSHGIVKRSTAKCSSALVSLASEFQDSPPPTPEYTLLSALSSYYSAHNWDTATMGCDPPSPITGSLGPAYTSFSSADQSWWDAHTSDIQDMYHACSDVSEVSPEITSLLSELGACPSVVADITGGSGGNDDAAPRATGAVMAAAGVAGLAAALIL